MHLGHFALHLQPSTKPDVRLGSGRFTSSPSFSVKADAIVKETAHSQCTHNLQTQPCAALTSEAQRGMERPAHAWPATQP